MFVKKESKLVTILYFVIAILALIFAICCFIPDVIGDVFPPETGYTSYEFYGGDAYTGIQHACADISNNVYYLGHSFFWSFYGIKGIIGLFDCIGYILMVSSLVFATLGIKSLKPATYIEVKTDNIVNEENKQSEN